MGKILLLAHISLDGFIANENGELSGFEPGEENLQFVCDLTTNAEAAMFGRKSYALLHAYWPQAKDQPNATRGMIAFSNWYNSATKIIVSNSMAGQQLHDSIIISDDIGYQIASLKKAIAGDILIFGSASLVQQLVPHDLVDEYWIFINPVLFGKGIPLFSGDGSFRKLKMEYTRQFDNGEIAMRFVLAANENEESKDRTVST